VNALILAGFADSPQLTKRRYRLYQPPQDASTQNHPQICATTANVPRFPADRIHVTAEDLVERELMLGRFNRLIGELARGAVLRTTFQPWEVELLLDFEACPIDPKRRVETLRQYQRAVARQLEAGPGPPLKLSQFLQQFTTLRP
jgi:hypothetical protein